MIHNIKMYKDFIRMATREAWMIEDEKKSRKIILATSIILLIITTITIITNL